MATLPCGCFPRAISFSNSSRLSSSFFPPPKSNKKTPSSFVKTSPFQSIFCSSSFSSSFSSFSSFSLIDRVGFQRRRSNVSFLSFGANPSYFSDEAKSESNSQLLSAMLPYVVAATAVVALVNPVSFAWISKDYYAPALGGIMLSIGIRLSVNDFALAFQRPLSLSIGFMAQYVLKPLLGLLIARAFGAPPMFYAGFILTCCVSGAQLSSYASFLSKGDVALSILLTSMTTILSALITPLLTGLLIGSVVPVDAVAMSKSILQVVLVPITLGLTLNTYAKPIVNVIQPIMPFVAMVCTSLSIGSPLAINRNQILSADGVRLLVPVLAFHFVAFTMGYWLSKIPFLSDMEAGQLSLEASGSLHSNTPFRQEESVCRTISLCTGMQSSTLAGLLASQFLGSSQAVPPACSVVAMAIMGLYLASFWGNGYRIRDIPKQLFPQIGNTHLNA